MSNYPVVLLPSKIEQVQSALPPVPVFSEPEPQEPRGEPRKINYSVLSVELASTIITTPILSQMIHVSAVLLFALAASAIAFHAWNQIHTFPKRKKEHSRRLERFRGERENYLRRRRRHEQEASTLRSPERVASYQHNLLLQILSQTVPHDGNGSNAVEGPSERRFGNCLQQCFPGKIQTGLRVQNPSYDQGYHYTPDFAYIDQQLNLYIDIEIDEPYSRSGQAIHFIGLGKQQARDDHFKSRGWVVVRFSEEQVVRYPKSCCKSVAEVVAKVTGNTSILSRFANGSDVPPVRRWTQEEAQQMAARGYRDTYLDLLRMDLR